MRAIIWLKILRTINFVPVENQLLFVHLPDLDSLFALLQRLMHLLEDCRYSHCQKALQRITEGCCSREEHSFAAGRPSFKPRTEAQKVSLKPIVAQKPGTGQLLRFGRALPAPRIVTAGQSCKHSGAGASCFNTPTTLRGAALHAALMLQISLWTSTRHHCMLMSMALLQPWLTMLFVSSSRSWCGSPRSCGPVWSRWACIRSR